MLLNKLYNDECMNFMQKLKNNSVDHILTDIPYNACGKYQDGLIKRIKKGQKVPKYMMTAKFFNKEADKLDIDLNVLIDEFLRVVKKSVLIFCSENQQIEIKHIIQNKKEVKSHALLYWAKTNAMPLNMEYNFVRNVECMIYFYKDSSSFNEEKKINYQTIIQPMLVNQYKKIHPTEKPNYILTQLIKTISKKGDIILDPFAGSGSTIINSILNERYGIGCEKNKNFYKKAQTRFEETKTSNLLFQIAIQNMKKKEI